MHCGITEVSEQQRQHIKQNNIEVMISQKFSLLQSFLNFLLDKQINLIQIF